MFRWVRNCPQCQAWLEKVSLADRLVCEVCTLTDEKDTTAKEQLGLICPVEPWAIGLPMAADGYEGKRYAKGWL